MDKNSIEKLVEEIADWIDDVEQYKISQSAKEMLVRLIASKKDEYYSPYFQKWILDETSYKHHAIAIMKDRNQFCYEASIKSGEPARSIIIEGGFETQEEAIIVAKRRIDGDWV
jgi:hypothetical protein